MKSWSIAGRGLAVGAIVAALAAGVAAQQQGGVDVGHKAPEFKLVGTDGKTYTLTQFHGKSWVVIAWYPKALTGG